MKICAAFKILSGNTCRSDKTTRQQLPLPTGSALLVPIVGHHVVVGHVAHLVHVGDAERLARRATRVGHRRAVHVPVAAIRRVALRHLVQAGVVLGAHWVQPARVLASLHEIPVMAVYAERKTLSLSAETPIMQHL